MTLTTLFTLLKRMISPRKSECPYKMEPRRCGASLEKPSVSLEKPLRGDLKQSMSVLGRKTMTRSRMLWLRVVFIALLLCLNACTSKVVLLKESDMRLLEDGNYSVSPSWMEERLQFENNMVKKLQECHSIN